MDDKQDDNAGQVEQVKVMAAGFSKKLPGVEPQALAAMPEPRQRLNAGRVASPRLRPRYG